MLDTDDHVIQEQPNEDHSMDMRSSNLGNIKSENEVAIPFDDANDEIILFIEYKYCTVCNVEQPLRCKHCR